MELGNFDKKNIEDAVINLTEVLESIKRNFKGVLIILLIIAIVGGIMSSLYKVGTEEMAVVLRLGKVHTTVESGLQFKLPFGIDKVFLVKTGRIFKEEFGFRSNVVGNRTIYSRTNFSDESLVLTGDLNVSDLEWIVQYQIEDPAKYLFNIHDPVAAIRDSSEAITRAVVGDANVSDVLTTERSNLANKIQKELQTILNSYEIGVRIVTVKLQDVNPPEKVRPAFNGVNEAEQQRESLILQAREQYNQQVPRASGEAKQMIQEAEGYALQRVNRASGEAARFISVLKEYEKFPKVTKKRLYLETIEKIMPRLGDITILDGTGKNSNLLPILPLQPLQGGSK